MFDYLIPLIVVVELVLGLLFNVRLPCSPDRRR
jgi:hypothetical protein